MLKVCVSKINVIFLLIITLCFFSCSKTEVVESITEDELFSLEYGNFEEQLNVFSLNDIGNMRTNLIMKDGFFYLVNGESDKIMELNSYGNLLTLFYNEDSLTKRLIESYEQSALSLHREISYPFDFSGQVSADGEKCLYVVCTIPRDRQEQSDDGTLLFCQAVLCIPRDGSQIDYIGQQGPGGTPFPLVKNIYTTENNELVVVAAANDGMNVYWFKDDGFLKYMIPIRSADIPKISGIDEDSSVYLTIDNVIPSFSDYKLSVKVDYYSSYSDKASKSHAGVTYLSTLLYPLNVETGMYESPISIPPYEESVIVDYSKLTYKLPYDFLGVTKNGWNFFVVSTSSGFDVEMIHIESQKIFRRHFDVNRANVLYHNMSLSTEGIISALYVENEKARVVWYRTDRLINS